MYGLQRRTIFPESDTSLSAAKRVVCGLALALVTRLRPANLHPLAVTWPASHGDNAMHGLQRRIIFPEGGTSLSAAKGVVCGLALALVTRLRPANLHPLVMTWPASHPGSRNLHNATHSVQRHRAILYGGALLVTPLLGRRIVNCRLSLRESFVDCRLSLRESFADCRLSLRESFADCRLSLRESFAGCRLSLRESFVHCRLSLRESFVLSRSERQLTLASSKPQ